MPNNVLVRKNNGKFIYILCASWQENQLFSMSFPAKKPEIGQLAFGSQELNKTQYDPASAEKNEKPDLIDKSGFLAQRVGFEPTIPEGTTDFESVPL